MSSPPAKRQRSENAPITRSEIWHTDGSVVLLADNTQFRVHWSVLSMHSSFFRAMQGLPQPPDQSSIDGCPVIQLQDDIIDVENLLKALYNPALFNAKAIPFPYISSFVRLGRKYDFKDLFSIAMERLAYENPPTLEAFVALSEAVAASPSYQGEYTTTRIVHYPGILYDIVTLARENNLLSILPCAYYRLAKFSLETVFQEIRRPDGSLSVLSSSDRAVCAVGHERLLQAQWKGDTSSLGWLVAWKPATECKDPSKCQLKRESLLRSVLLSTQVYGFIMAEYVKKRFCSACGEVAGAAVTAGRAKMWDDLPAAFGLPPWNDLKNASGL